MFWLKQIYLLLKSVRNCRFLEKPIVNFKIFVFKFG